MSVSEAFAKLIDRFQPTSVELQSAERHASQIKTRLSQSFTLRKLLVAGSYARQTYIHNSSDVDLFAVFARDDLRKGGHYVSSATALGKLKRELEGRYPSTSVYKDIHAIVVCFSDGSRIDVVPLIFQEMTSSNWPLYRMPDGSHDWMGTSPELHSQYIKNADEKSRGKLRRTAQIIKFWRECRTPRVPLSSFHIEMLLASFGICEGIKSYAECVTEALQLLAERDCHALRDPLQVCGNIEATKSILQRDTTLRSIIHSRSHAKDALYAERHGDIPEAKRQWNIVFCNQFPR